MKKGNMLNYRKKKETIKKKTMELSILCGVKACVVLVDPNGQVDTWPENPTDLNPIIQSYKKSLIDGKKVVKSKKNLDLFCDNDDDQWLSNMSRESKESLLVKLNPKLAAVEKRIEFLKMVNNGHGVAGDVTGLSSRGKEVVVANQETHNSDFEFLESSVGINGDQLRNNSANYNQGNEVIMADQEFWESSGAISGDQLRKKSAYNQENEVIMADQEFWESSGAISGDQLRNNSAYNQENQVFMADQEFWESSDAISGDQLRNNSAYNQGNEFVVADQEFWGSVAINNGDKLRNCSAYDQVQGVDIFGHDGQLVVMPTEMNMWETLNNLEKYDFGTNDLWPVVSDPEFDLLPQEATGFGTLLNSLLANEPNYDYSMPFSTDTF
ncbi:agamous-like MADS-box protein AGL81 [Lycium barbarum]|uniref:agamous-like MADS-box protein AGL81 n=1 Tax=Lycium barbarum TaxID=112863 RepID=UPI00293F4840|nr:agamous-like MADS-box protein AGL81 [Lycium barbarum]